MNTKLSVIIIALVVIAGLAIFVLNIIPHKEIKPKEVLPPQEEEQVRPITSKYELPPAVKTEDIQIPASESKQITDQAESLKKAKKLTTDKTTPPSEEGDSQEGTYKPQKYPEAEKMQQMQQEGIVLY